MSETSKSSLSLALIDQVVVSGGSLIISIIAARELGPSGFGAYVLATGLYLFLAGFQNAFVIGPLAIFGAAHDVNVSKYIWATATSQRFISIGIASICIVVSVIFGLTIGVRDLSQAFLGAGIAGYFSLRSDFWRQVLISRRMLRETLLCDVLNRAVAVTLIIAAIVVMKRLSLTMVYGCLTISSFLGTTIASRMAKSLVEKCEGFERQTHLARNWAFGKWTATDYSITIAAGQIGPYFLASMLGTASTGILGAVNQLTGVLHVFLNGVANYTYPLLVKEYCEGGRQNVYRFAGRMIRYLSSGVSLIIIPAFILAPTLINWVYSVDYEHNGVTPFRIICCVGFVLAFSRPLDMALRVTEQVKIRSAISLLELVFVLFSMYPAIIIGGVAGATSVILMGRCLVAICLFLIVFTNAGEKWKRILQPNE